MPKNQRLENKEKYQKEIFAKSLNGLRDIVNSKRILAWNVGADSSSFEKAVALLLNYLGIDFDKDILKDMNRREELDDTLVEVGVMHREVALEGKWYKQSMGSMLVKKTNGGYAALLPTVGGRYMMYDYENNERCYLTDKLAAMLEKKAYVLYPPLPQEKLSASDLFRYMLKQLSIADFVFVGVMTLAVTLLGLVLPQIIQLIYLVIIPGETVGVLIPLMLMMCCIPVATLLINTVRGLCAQRVKTKIGVFVHAAFMGRLVMLPVSFFAKYDAGDIAKRVASSENISETISDSFLTTGFTALFSLLYLFQIAAFAPSFVVPAVIVVGVSFLVSALTIVKQVKFSRKLNEGMVAVSSELYDVMSDIQKIKLSGAEPFVFSNWVKNYTPIAAFRYNPPILLRVGVAITEAALGIGTLVIYFIAVGANTGSADFIAFSASFGMLMGAMASMLAIVQSATQLIPALEMIKPILEETPEKQRGKKPLKSITGSISIEHLYFRYAEDTPYILEDVSLEIPSGQYLAVVGKTGSGKSTLVRSLLGFQIPEKGTVCVDGNDLRDLNLQTYRRHLGVVLQNGDLISGSIYDNITIAAPWATEADAWEAAEIADIADDINKLPMGMRTMLSSTSSAVSGGQKQRLMIARAVVAKPKILILDEATSSLDNETQTHITKALDELNCTRVVVAHRLSTIRHCDRIVVIEDGRIREDGTYAELLGRNGLFAELVERQQLDSELELNI